MIREAAAGWPQRSSPAGKATEAGAAAVVAWLLRELAAGRIRYRYLAADGTTHYDDLPSSFYTGNIASEFIRQPLEIEGKRMRFFMAKKACKVGSKVKLFPAHDYFGVWHPPIDQVSQEIA
jgi:hypothetical protein